MPDLIYGRTLVHAVNTYRWIKSTDAIKNPKETRTRWLSNAQCRIKPVRADSQQTVGGMVFDADFRARFLGDTDITIKDEVETIQAPGYEGVYQVMGVEKFRDELRNEIHHTVVHLKYIPLSTPS